MKQHKKDFQNGSTQQTFMKMVKVHSNRNLIANRPNPSNEVYQQKFKTQLPINPFEIFRRKLFRSIHQAKSPPLVGQSQLECLQSLGNSQSSANDRKNLQFDCDCTSGFPISETDSIGTFNPKKLPCGNCRVNSARLQVQRLSTLRLNTARQDHQLFS